MDIDSDDYLTQCTQGTQGFVDPRRMGRNNSGLTNEDVGDVIVILHPATPAAFQLVAETARLSPQHVLQNLHPALQGEQASPSLGEEQETFILDNYGGNTALDLAFRFSSNTVQPHLGFTFGRNPAMCDIAVTSDAHRRVSNLHFVIYMNDSGVVMLKDMSTNGTMVDEVWLRARGGAQQQTRMLNNGNCIQILSLNPAEVLKFVVRIPSRQGQEEDFQRNFAAYMDRQAEAEANHRQENGEELLLAPKPAQQNTVVKMPIIRSAYGMHWNGGEKYNVVGHIGRGAFASVYQLATKLDGHLYAAKELEKRRFMKNGILDRKLENEMNIMQSINHPSIVQFHEHHDIANHLYIIMEFVPCGDLQQYLTEHGALREFMGKQMAMQVLDALDYLHEKQITHRDIKPDNILIASKEYDNFVIKLSDFGLSKVVRDNDTFLKTFCGTLLYCAPEVFPHYDTHVGSKGIKRPRKPPPTQSKKSHSYSQAVDIWSFGAVLWYSLCHKPPFEGVPDNTGRGMFDKIMMTPLDATDLIEHGVSDDAVDLLVQMLNTDPLARPLPEECMRHRWFGDQPIPARSQPQLELGAIAEEGEETEVGNEPNVASLSLYEPKSGQNSELSINSADMDFFDPRQSKRFKLNEPGSAERDASLFESSQELFDDIPIINEAEQAPPNVKPPKLFGEISKSDLQNPIFAGRAYHAREADPSSTSSEQHMVQNAQDTASGAPETLLSLQGTESMVREMNMDSDISHDCSDGVKDEPKTPGAPLSLGSLRAPDDPQELPSNDQDETPRPPQPATFNRRINMAVPPSIFYVPEDPSTHNIEYASAVSGHDFAANPLYRPSDASLLATLTHSNSSDAREDRKHSSSATSRAGKTASLPSRPTFGELVSTQDSFANITMGLHELRTWWGRAATNTYVYEDKADTRVPKCALTIFFNAPGIDMVTEKEDIINLPGLYCGIVAHASNGLRINGVLLKNEEGGKHLFGKLHTGDEIEIWSPGRDRRAGLKFIVRIFHGEGKKRRPSHGPRFKIDRQGPSAITDNADKKKPGANIDGAAPVQCC